MAKKQAVTLDDIMGKYGVEKEQHFEPTGSIALDAVLGGGICTGGFYAFWGPQGSGKTTLALQVIKKFCKKGMKCAFIDVEKAFNINQQQAFGLREYIEDRTLLHLTVDNYSQCDEVCTALSKMDDIKLVVVDSESQLLVSGLEDVDVTSERPGQKSRQASLLLSKQKALFYNAGISSIWLFHARANISMGPANPYAPQDKMAGGFAQKHVPDAIIKIQPGSKLKDDDKVVGQNIHIQAEKNKFCPPFNVIDAPLKFGKGIDARQEIIDFATQQGLIEQKGSFFIVDGETIRGKQALYELPKEKLKTLRDQIVVKTD